MPISYLKGHSWSDLTREERYYCYILYSYARVDAAEFARWLNQKCGLSLDLRSEWDLGLEVCFYRDYLWHQERRVRETRFSPKRTFDLCLFGENDIVIIETKVDQPFDREQNAAFAADRTAIPQLLESEKVRVSLIALASSKYLSSATHLDQFSGTLSWADVHQKYGDRLLKQADDLYGVWIPKLRDPAA